MYNPIYVTPDQAQIMYAALQMYREENETLLSYDAQIGKDQHSINNLLDIFTTLYEAEAIQKILIAFYSSL